ncbi:MAG TPA: DUF2752 domain-containing protein [Segetibacter sp.]
MTKEKKQLDRLFITSAAGIIAAMLYFYFDARYYSFFPRCTFFKITGFLCPGCGSQRAVSSLLQGDLVQALHFNVLAVASFPFILFSYTVSVLNALRIEPLIQNIFYSPLFVKIVLAVVILFFVIRNIAVYPFTLLSPDVKS